MDKQKVTKKQIRLLGDIIEQIISEGIEKKGYTTMKEFYDELKKRTSLNVFTFDPMELIGWVANEQIIVALSPSRIGINERMN